MTATSFARPAAERAAQSTGRHDVRRTVLAAIACALGVFPLCELFTDRGWLLDVWLTMAVVTVPSAVLRRTRRASAGQVWIGVVLLIPWLTARFVHQHAVLGFIPLHGAWHQVGALMTDLHETTTNQAAPVHTTVAIRLALCALLGLVTALVDLLAVVGRRGALAGVPLLVIFTISGAVPRSPVSWTWFVLAAIGFLILLSLDSADDLQRWGHLVPRRQSAATRRGPTMFGGRRTTAAQRIAVVAIALAITVPLLVPGQSRNAIANLFHSSRASDVGGGFGRQSGSGTAGIDPMAALKGELERSKNAPLFDVTVSPRPGETLRSLKPFYLRTNVLSLYEGSRWLPGFQDNGSDSIDSSQFLRIPGIPPSLPTESFAADITINQLASNPPMFADPVSVSGVDGSTEWDLRDQLLVNSTTDKGQLIHEEVAQPDPTVADLESATGQDPAMRSYLQLPSIRPFVRRTTARVIAGARTPFDKARAILNYFRGSNFSYSLSTAGGTSGDDLTDFLKEKVGFCQQYAGAMAVMLRLSGVPSRVVLGYAHPAPDRTGSFTVGSFDAHAWVEAYFVGLGWVPFDPTPLAGVPGAKASQPAWTLLPHHQSQTENANKSPTGPGRDHFVPAQHDTPTKPSGPVSLHQPGGSGMSPAVIVVLALLAALVLVLLTPMVMRAWQRRRRLRLARRGDTEALWAELSATATDLGYAWSAARSPRQVATWLVSASDTPVEAVRTLTSAVERARYATPRTGQGPTAIPHPSSDQDLVSVLKSVRAGLRARRSPAQRLQARLWPASLEWSGVPLVGRWLPGGSAFASGATPISGERHRYVH